MTCTRYGHYDTDIVAGTFIFILTSLLGAIISITFEVLMGKDEDSSLLQYYAMSAGTDSICIAET